MGEAQKKNHSQNELDDKNNAVLHLSSLNQQLKQENSNLRLQVQMYSNRPPNVSSAAQTDMRGSQIEVLLSRATRAEGLNENLTQRLNIVSQKADKIEKDYRAQEDAKSALEREIKALVDSKTKLSWKLDHANLQLNAKQHQLSKAYKRCDYLHWGWTRDYVRYLEEYEMHNELLKSINASGTPDPNRNTRFSSAATYASQQQYQTRRSAFGSYNRSIVSEQNQARGSASGSNNGNNASKQYQSQYQAGGSASGFNNRNNVSGQFQPLYQAGGPASGSNNQNNVSEQYQPQYQAGGPAFGSNNRKNVSEQNQAGGSASCSSNRNNVSEQFQPQYQAGRPASGSNNQINVSEQYQPQHQAGGSASGSNNQNNVSEQNQAGGPRSGSNNGNNVSEQYQARESPCCSYDWRNISKQNQAGKPASGSNNQSNASKVKPSGGLPLAAGKEKAKQASSPPTNGLLKVIPKISKVSSNVITHVPLLNTAKNPLKNSESPVLVSSSTQPIAKKRQKEHPKKRKNTNRLSSNKTDASKGEMSQQRILIVGDADDFDTSDLDPTAGFKSNCGLIYGVTYRTYNFNMIELSVPRIHNISAKTGAIATHQDTSNFYDFLAKNVAQMDKIPLFRGKHCLGSSEEVLSLKRLMLT